MGILLHIVLFHFDQYLACFRWWWWTLEFNCCDLYLMYCYLKVLCVSPTGLSDQVWLTASPASVQKDSNTTKLRYDRPTDVDNSHNNTVFNPSKTFHIV